MKPASGWKFKRITTSPGEMLREEFLKPMGISQNRLALDIRVPSTRIGQIAQGRRSVSADTALRLGRYFGTSAEFWLNLQQTYHLSKAMTEHEKTIAREVQVYAARKQLKKARSARAPKTL